MMTAFMVFIAWVLAVTAASRATLKVPDHPDCAAAGLQLCPRLAGKDRAGRGFCNERVASTAPQRASVGPVELQDPMPGFAKSSAMPKAITVQNERAQAWIPRYTARLTVAIMSQRRSPYDDVGA